MNIPGVPYNRIDEFTKEAQPVLKELQEILQKHGIQYVFAACLAQNHPVDGQDLVSFASNTGMSSTQYHNPRLITALQHIQGQGILILDTRAITHGVFIPKVIPNNPKSN